VTVNVPKKLSRRQRELIEELEKEFEAQSNKKGWFKR
jgi:DnaJ-class molecular chaperone